MNWLDVSETMPDSDQTVLGCNPRWDEPVWPCYHDGEHWRYADGLALLGSMAPTHWMDFPAPPVLPAPRAGSGGGAGNVQDHPLSGAKPQ